MFPIYQSCLTNHMIQGIQEIIILNIRINPAPIIDYGEEKQEL